MSKPERLARYFVSYRCDGCGKVNTRGVYEGTVVKSRMSIGCYNCGPMMHTCLGRTTPRKGGAR